MKFISERKGWDEITKGRSRPRANPRQRVPLQRGQGVRKTDLGEQEEERASKA